MKGTIHKTIMIFLGIMDIPLMITIIWTGFSLMVYRHESLTDTFKNAKFSKTILNAKPYLKDSTAIFNFSCEVTLYAITLSIFNLTSFLWSACVLQQMENMTRLIARLKVTRFSRFFLVEDFHYNLRKLNRNERVTSASMRKCALEYAELLQKGKRINHVFAFYVLITIPILSLQMICWTFAVCLWIQREDNDQTAAENAVIDEIYILILLDLFYFTGLVEIILPCTLVDDTNDDFTQNLNKFEEFVKENRGYCQDVSHNEISSLILHNFHQKLEFNALGMFKIDGSLLYGLFGSITTTLIILIQFEI
ncbi:uncharacterized protein [Atheta coriaria]|uniref:uncharacterized protein n=1 Tax=Dalotia coriaria TaxID=877792 RepID=UPI0031F3C3C2